MRCRCSMLKLSFLYVPSAAGFCVTQHKVPVTLTQLGLATKESSGELYSTDSVMHSISAEKKYLEDLIGVGKGKHADKKRRMHANKYSSSSKRSALDPWEQQLQQVQDEVDLAEMQEVQRRKEIRERGKVEFPSQEDINPYDPSTFGFMELGFVIGSHGVKGEVKVQCSTGFGMEKLCTAGKRYIKSPNRRYPREINLLEGRLQCDDLYILKLEGIATRDKAANLREHVLYIKENDRPELGDGEYIVSDLVGLQVYLDPGKKEYVGEVKGIVVMDDLGVIAGKGQDLLELELPPIKSGGPLRMCYVPLVDEIVPIICVEEKYMLIEPPEGLLDLAIPKKERVVIRAYLKPAEDTAV